MTTRFSLQPIGMIRQHPDRTVVEIFPAFEDGLMGLDGFSHIVVCFGFDRNDNPQARATLKQTHPRADERNLLTGVFATHSPRRPNLIAVSGNCLTIDRIDALDQTPVIDIKCYIPSSRFPGEPVRLPDWV